MLRFDPRSFLMRTAVLFGFWIVLAGIKPVDLAAGLLAAMVAAAASLHVFPPTARRRRPFFIIRLALRFLYQSVVAGVDVAWRALHPALPLRPGFVTFESQLPEGDLRAGFCTVTSLLPGTLPVGQDESGRLLIHALDTTRPVAEQLRQEEALFARATGGGAGG